MRVVMKVWLEERKEGKERKKGRRKTSLWCGQGMTKDIV